MSGFPISAPAVESDLTRHMLVLFLMAGSRPNASGWQPFREL
ncbi:MAG: hypothetical protein JWO13_4121, partial [Acidobacteriales bacterium]|nr:hypothetical protein [Terriglobales bacterium]